jgi:squalene-hopene/tetraprenyl-beta-curcumene cyclase
MRIILSLIVIFALSSVVFAAETAGKAEPSVVQLKADIVKAMEKGIEYILKQQNADGSFSDEPMNPGVTGLVISSIAGSPLRDKYIKTEAFEKALAFVLKCIKEDGGIYTDELAQNYHTAICLSMLASINDPKYAEQIKKTQEFVKSLQAGNKFELESADEQNKGGFGYRAGFKGADMSNTQFALTALKESGLTADDEVWKRALQFVEKCQNKVDGGGIYRPNESKAGVDEKGNYRSYQSMTYAGLLSFIYANVDKDDKRVQAAVKWITKNWNLKENVPMGKQGLYYNYHTMAKALAAYGEKSLTDDKGVKHDWYRELAQALIENQNKEGYWVNESDRWFESDKVLVTTYALLALNQGYGDYK